MSRTTSKATARPIRFIYLRPHTAAAAKLCCWKTTWELWRRRSGRVSDPAQAVLPAGGYLAVSGGTGVDGQTYVAMSENIELAGAVVLQHGEFSFMAPSQGVVGGLYAGAVSAASCLAGFNITPNGNGCTIQALVSGAASGAAVATANGHRYVLVTRFYCVEPFRTAQLFHSGLHPSGSGVGGATIAADVNVVMELRDDRSNQSGKHAGGADGAV